MGQVIVARFIGPSASGDRASGFASAAAWHSDLSRKDAARYAVAEPWRCSALAAVSPVIENPNQPGTNPERFDSDALDGPGEIRHAHYPDRRQLGDTGTALIARTRRPASRACSTAQ